MDDIKKKVSDMSGRGVEEVRIVVSPYRICPLGAHIDHQVSLSCMFVPDCQISWMVYYIINPQFVDTFVQFQSNS